MHEYAARVILDHLVSKKLLRGHELGWDGRLSPDASEVNEGRYDDHLWPLPSEPDGIRYVPVAEEKNSTVYQMRTPVIRSSVWLEREQEDV